MNIDPNWTVNQPFVQFFPVRDVTDRTTFQPGECAPLKLFGEGRSSQAALDFIQVDTTDRSRLNQHVVRAAWPAISGASSLSVRTCF